MVIIGDTLQSEVCDTDCVGKHWLWISYIIINWRMLKNDQISYTWKPQWIYFIKCISFFILLQIILYDFTDIVLKPALLQMVNTISDWSNWNVQSIGNNTEVTSNNFKRMINGDKYIFSKMFWVLSFFYFIKSLSLSYISCIYLLIQYIPCGW